VRIKNEDMIIRVKNLKLRTTIGIFDWERKIKQDIIINYAFRIDGILVRDNDAIESTVDYKTLNKKIIKEVEESEFFLIEKLAQHILNLIMSNDRVKEATVEVDKPNALHYSDSVSVECKAKR